MVGRRLCVNWVISFSRLCVVKIEHRPSIKRLDYRVHVNSIIPYNLRICHVADKHGGQLSEKKKEREEKGCRWLLWQSSIKSHNERDGGPPHYVCTSSAKSTSFCLFRLQTCSWRFLRSLSSWMGIFDRKNSPESRRTLTSLFLFPFFSPVANIVCRVRF